MIGSAVASPLTGSHNTTPVARVPVPRITGFYSRHLGVDVDRFFTGLDTLTLLRCEDTGYEFYHPAETAGDERFYSDLARQPWYYDEARWEHARAVGWCDEASSVLDVGCGSGAFLQLVRERRPGCRVEGMEFNPRARAEAAARGFTVHAEALEDLARAAPGSFDVVTAFQVLEHLPQPRAFLDAMVAVARPGGILILGVPNNDGYLAGTTAIPSYVLNMPPHHMGLWRPSSLARLVGLLPLELLDLEEEPFDEALLERAAYGRVARALGGGMAAALAWRLGIHRVYARLRGATLRAQPGHSLLARFRRL